MRLQALNRCVRYLCGPERTDAKPKCSTAQSGDLFSKWTPTTARQPGGLNPFRAANYLR